MHDQPVPLMSCPGQLSLLDELDECPPRGIVRPELDDELQDDETADAEYRRDQLERARPKLRTWRADRRYLKAARAPWRDL